MTGGAVVSIYSEGKYVSKDADFLSLTDHQTIKKAMYDLGFKNLGKDFYHDDCNSTVEFPGYELVIGDEPMKPEGKIKSGSFTLKLLSPTQCVMDKRLDRITNDLLRDAPCDPSGLRQYISELSESLESATEPIIQVRLLGEMSVHLRSLEELDSAKNNLLQALEIIEKNQLGIKLEIQQKIRLAHVLQWQSLYDESNALFQKIISICRSDAQAAVYLDFALQHSGKNLFEQKRFSEALVQFEEAMSIRTKRNAPADQIESTKLAITKTKSLTPNNKL